MANAIKKIKKELRQGASRQKAKDLARFFKTGPGEYAEGDKFLGVMVPQTRIVVKKYWEIATLDDVGILLAGEFHEERLLALLFLVKKFEKSNEADRKKIFDLYLAKTKYINNWDLVDLTAPRIVGAYLYGRDDSILYELARSEELWERRIAMLATFWFISKGSSETALKIAEILVDDKEDLIHKAVGWGLREIGKRCGQEAEERFLIKHYKTMPRTMLRYAIEKFDAGKKNFYMGRSQ